MQDMTIHRVHTDMTIHRVHTIWCHPPALTHITAHRRKTKDVIKFTPCFWQGSRAAAVVIIEAGFLGESQKLISTFFNTYLLLGAEWEANLFRVSQEIPRISRNTKVHYRTHNYPPPVSILVQPNPVHTPTSHLLEIHRNIIHSSTSRSPQWYPSLRFPHQDPIYPLSSPIRATCPAHLILLDFITHKILGEEYKSFSSSLCSLLHSRVISSLLGPNILNTVFPNTLNFLSSLNVRDQVSHPYKTTGKIIVLYIHFLNTSQSL